ncbi:MAG: hypothetical protein HKO11_08140, partial [Eudoraea sp.]|nr:hypothetical protein [Eudoraea sp.]
MLFGVLGYAQPTVSVTSSETSPTNANPFTITITFSEDVTGFDDESTDIIVGNGTPVALSIAGGPQVYTAEITPTSDGTVTVDIPLNAAQATIGGLPNTASPQFSIDYDGTPPGISISVPSADPTSGGPVSYTVTYSGESSISLSDDDIVLNPTGTAVASSATVSGSTGSTRTVTIDGITGDGTLGITIASGTASDLAGNLAP